MLNLENYVCFHSNEWIKFTLESGDTYSGPVHYAFKKNTSRGADLYVDFPSCEDEDYSFANDRCVRSFVVDTLTSITPYNITSVCQAESDMQGDTYAVFECLYDNEVDITRSVRDKVFETKSYTEKAPAHDDTPYPQIGKEIGELVSEKQLQYGDSFGRSGAMLKILYPSGVPVDKLEDVLVIARVLDKIFRIATNNDPLGEDPWSDVCGYAMLAIRRNETK